MHFTQSTSIITSVDMFLSQLLFPLVLCSLLVAYIQNDYILKKDYLFLEYYNRKFIENATARSTKLNRTYLAYSIYCVTKRDFDGDTFKVNLEIKKIADNIPKLPIAQFDVKICQVIDKDLFGMKEILRELNLTNCPYKKGQYFVKDFYINENRFPPHIPEGKYETKITFFYDDDILARLVTRAEIIYKIKY